MIGLNDLFATCATLVGQKLPADAGRDSLDQSRVLLGRPGAAVRTELVEQGISNALALRAGGWKFIPQSPQQTVSGMGSGANPADKHWGGSIVREDVLYELAADPGETTNVIARHPEQAAAHRARLAAIRHHD